MIKYFDEEWPKEEEILNIGLKMSRQNKKDRQKVKRVFCIGNGESRQGFDLEKLRPHGKIYGCNAIYRDFMPDVLTAVDHGIMNEIYHAGIAQKIPCYFMDARSESPDTSLINKTVTVFEAAGFDKMINEGDVVAIKMHCGELGSSAYIRPAYVRAIADKINIGIAIDTSYGLIVPNIKNANKKSIFEISEEVKELANLANKRRLKNDQLVGATFTISSLSGVGGKYFTPIINPPEVGILGLSKTYDSLQLDNLKLQTTNQLPLSLSYDHRVINGVYAIKFLNELNKQLNDLNFLESSFK